MEAMEGIEENNKYFEMLFFNESATNFNDVFLIFTIAIQKSSYPFYRFHPCE